MEPDAAHLASLIGTRVRGARQARGWTLDGLAETAGVSRRMIVSVEQGTVNPSLGTLLRISTALGVPLPALVETPAAARVRITRADDGLALWTGDGGGIGRLVASADDDGAFELWDWVLEPGESRAADAHTAGTRELAQVHAGTLTIEVDGTPHTLNAGDAIAFHGDLAHAYANRGSTSVHFSLAVREPVAPRPRPADA